MVAPTHSIDKDVISRQTAGRNYASPTNLPKVRNHPVRFIDKLAAPLPKGSGAVFII